MKLHLIYRRGTNKRTLDLFKKEALELDVEIIEVVSNDFDFSQFDHVGPQDAVYCMSDDRVSRLVEKSIISPQTRTLYKDYTTAIAKVDDGDDISSYLIHKTCGLPVIDSIPVITQDRELLKKYIKKLHGFPVVIKALGGSKGHGTMLVDSIESLHSIDDYLVKTRDRFIIKRYIQEAKSVRAVVVGERVVAAIEHKALDGDFRSNSGHGDHQSSAYELSPREAAIAVSAVRTLGFAFGGVDLSIDHKGDVYITEVNMPCSFVVTQKYADESIARAMMQHLINQ